MRQVEIILSEDLTKLDLSGLVGRNGYVVEELDYPERKNKGFLITFEEEFCDEFIWFIPKESIRYV